MDPDLSDTDTAESEHAHAVRCAWCGLELHAGPLPVSHGICPECLDAEFGEESS